MPKPNTLERRVRLFKNGRNQAVRIPRDLELPGNEAMIRREGNSLILTPMQHGGLLELLDTAEALPFPSVPDPTGQLDDIEL